MGSTKELDSGDNLVFIFDVSYSMQADDTPTGKNRLDYSKEKAIGLVIEAVKYDPDGVDVGIFGKGARWVGKATGANATDLIGPLKPSDGQTDTHAAIQLAYDLHVKNQHQQTFLFLVTDGEPSDRQKVRDTIAGIAEKLKDEHEFAIGFLTVGKIDPGLQSFLKELDDTLKAKHDIVDVRALEEVEDLIQVATAALHD
jgi:Mg-chelatase subunit ChlD